MPSSSPFIRAGVLKSSPIRLSRIEKEKTLKKFEERLTRLEEISEKIKSADLPLEEALAAFEEGIKLAKTLEKDIDKISNSRQYYYRLYASLESEGISGFSDVDIVKGDNSYGK